MKLQKYIQALIVENLDNGLLYHGSPYKFKNFKPTTAFFSETINFAADYSDQKSFESGMDADSIIYTVKLVCSSPIFDINNPAHKKALVEKLPKSIDFSYNNFGFTTAVDKNEYLLNLSGYMTNEPVDGLQNLKVGDVFPNPEYKRDEFKVYDKDEDYLYYYDTSAFASQRNKAIKSGKYSELFKPVYEFLYDYIITLHPEQTYVGQTEVLNFYNAFKNNAAYFDIPKPSQDKIPQFKELENNFNRGVLQKMVEEKYIHKFNLTTTIDKLKDTWRYYENGTTDVLIKSLGFCGYIALEKGVKTYAIFRPDRDVKILKINL